MDGHLWLADTEPEAASANSRILFPLKLRLVQSFVPQ